MVCLRKRVVVVVRTCIQLSGLAGFILDDLAAGLACFVPVHLLQLLVHLLPARKNHDIPIYKYATLGL
jgi:hypothetical protein